MYPKFDLIERNHYGSNYRSFNTEFNIVDYGFGGLYKLQNLGFPDLSADGSFTLGAAITAVALTNGISPAVGTMAALIAGLLAGLITGILHVKLRYLICCPDFSYGDFIFYKFKDYGKGEYSSFY